MNAEGPRVPPPKIPSVESAPDRTLQIISNFKEPKLQDALLGIAPENHPNREIAARKLAKKYLEEIPQEQRANAYSQILSDTPSVFVFGEIVKEVTLHKEIFQDEIIYKSIGDSAETLVVNKPWEVFYALTSLAEANPAFVLKEATSMAQLQRDGVKGGTWTSGANWFDENIRAVNAAVSAELPPEARTELPQQLEGFFNTLAEVPQNPSQAGYTVKALTEFVGKHPDLAGSARALMETLVVNKPWEVFYALTSLAKANPAFVLKEATSMAQLQRDGVKVGTWTSGANWLDENIRAVNAAVSAELPPEARTELPQQLEGYFQTLSEVPQNSVQVGYTVEALAVFLDGHPDHAAAARSLMEATLAVEKKLRADDPNKIRVLDKIRQAFSNLAPKTLEPVSVKI